MVRPGTILTCSLSQYQIGFITESILILATHSLHFHMEEEIPTNKPILFSCSQARFLLWSTTNSTLTIGPNVYMPKYFNKYLITDLISLRASWNHEMVLDNHPHHAQFSITTVRTIPEITILGTGFPLSGISLSFPAEVSRSAKNQYDTIKVDLEQNVLLRRKLDVDRKPWLVQSWQK